MANVQEALARARQIIENQRLAKIAKQAANEEAAGMQRAVPLGIPSSSPTGLGGLTWNAEQQLAIDYGFYGKTFCLIGPAGSGKTTTLRAMLLNLLQQNRLPPLEEATKHLVAGSPGVALISFTRRAVRNIAKQMPEELKSHCITFHKLVEYGPEFYEVWDEDTQTSTAKVRFVPGRHGGNPLPRNLKLIIIDESSMFSIEFFEQLIEALPHPHAVQFVFLGDLNQLPPVYGIPILAKMLSAKPIVELTQIYRQALESPIIALALGVKDNNFDEFNKLARNGWGAPPIFNAASLKDKVTLVNPGNGKVTLHPWKKKIDQEDALNAMQGQLRIWMKEGIYDPDEDLVLCPWNTSFGTDELNLAIADYLSTSKGLIVHEVIAGFQKYYLSVGDKLLVDKQEAVILKIDRNLRYMGKTPQHASTELNRWGAGGKAGSVFDDNLTDEQLDLVLLHAADVVDRTAEASHAIKVRFLDSDTEETLTKSAQLNAMSFAYAITVHKAQGSECRRVFLLTHACHAAMCSRELIYTAITRAKEELYIVMEPGLLGKAASKPRIKGDTLADKIAFFQSRLEDKGQA